MRISGDGRGRSHGSTRPRETRSQLAALALVLTLSTVQPVAAEVIERVVAVINDEAVFLSQLRRKAAPFLESVVLEAPAGQRKARIDALYGKLLEQLVDDVLIQQTARDLELSVSSLEVDQAIDNVRRSNGMDEAQFWQAVATQGFNQSQYRADVRKQLLRLKVINQKVRARVSVSDAQVHEEYNSRMRRARRQQRFRAAHILFPLSEAAGATEVAATAQEAKALRSTLTRDNFLAAAEGRIGGSLGWLNQGDLPSDLENALLDLNVGDVSAPVRGPAGIHIFLLEERQEQAVAMPTFEESRGMIQQELVGKAMERQERIFLSELRKSAVIDLKL